MPFNGTATHPERLFESMRAENMVFHPEDVDREKFKYGELGSPKRSPRSQPLSSLPEENEEAEPPAIVDNSQAKDSKNEGNPPSHPLPSILATLREEIETDHRTYAEAKGLKKFSPEPGITSIEETDEPAKIEIPEVSTQDIAHCVSFLDSFLSPRTSEARARAEAIEELAAFPTIVVSKEEECFTASAPADVATKSNTSLLMTMIKKVRSATDIAAKPFYPSAKFNQEFSLPPRHVRNLSSDSSDSLKNKTWTWVSRSGKKVL